MTEDPSAEPGDSPPASPTLDDVAVNKRFWLGQGRKVLESRVTKIEDAAGKLVTAVGWFWTVYSAAALIGVALADRQLDDGVIVIIAIPSILLIIAYLFATWALMPVYASFYVEIPEDIKSELKTAFDKKRLRLTVAQWITGIAAVAVLGAVLATAFADPKASQTFAADHVLEGGQGVVVVTGHFDVGQQVTVQVSPAKDPQDAESSSATFKAGPSGDLEGDVGPLTGTAATWTVTASWEKDDVAHTSTLTVNGTAA